ncbi:MAG: hypothetical protein Ct9H300mP13_4970 [Gammaproteobacteria bacterium]|nr:MAG: hypothetical protein Ct9H300mP13_4970 [Gammaproteobacteria bacterium]
MGYILGWPFSPLGSEFGVMGGVFVQGICFEFYYVRRIINPKQIRSRTGLASAISGLVLGASLMAQPIAAVAGSVVTLWHTEPNPQNRWRDEGNYR